MASGAAAGEGRWGVGRISSLETQPEAFRFIGALYWRCDAISPPHMNDAHYLAAPVWGVTLLMSRRDRTAADGAEESIGRQRHKVGSPPPNGQSARDTHYETVGQAPFRKRPEVFL